MKANQKWSYSPYRPLFTEVGEIYICRIVPYKTSIHIEWLDLEEAKEYTIYYRKRNLGEFVEAGRSSDCGFDIAGLEQESDYEFYIEYELKKSRVRLARTGECFFGSAVNYLHPEDEAYTFSGKYLCSPSLVRLPDGVLVVSMDVYAAEYPQNLSLVFRSEDGGKSWHYACELFPCFWGELFLYQNELYMLACSTENGDLLIGKSVDGGRSFCEPTVLLRGSNGKNGDAGVSKSPQPVVEHNGRIWTAMEWGSWGRNYYAPMVASAEIGSDILKAENWLFSEPVRYDPTWEGVADVKGNTVGAIEGCVVNGHDGKLYNVMRYEMRTTTPNYGRALVYGVNTENPEAPLCYQRAMEFPANNSEFEIKYDQKSESYYTLANRILDSENALSRNLLSLMRSRDLYRWEIVHDVIDRRDKNPQEEGFQYVEFEIEGDDILYLCRTAINGAHNYHDANYTVFDRIRNFRNL